MDDNAVVRFVDDDTKDGRLNGDLVFRESILGDDTIGIRLVVNVERVARHTNDACCVDDVADLEPRSSGLLRIRVKVA